MDTLKIKSILFFICFTSALQLFAQQENIMYLYDDLVVNRTYSLFGDNVKLREKPSTTSKEITRLRIGFDVKILSKTTFVFEDSNSKTLWYEVLYKDKKGFIPAKFIARKKLNHGTINFYFNRTTSKTRGDQLAIRTVIDKEYSDYKEKVIQLRGANISVALEDNHNLLNVTKILTLQYHGESCGAENGITYLFLMTNNEFIHIADLSSSGDVGFFLTESFAFEPNEHNGETMIVFTKEEGEDINEDSSWVETKKLVRHFAWDGEKMIPKFSKSFKVRTEN